MSSTTPDTLVSHLTDGHYGFDMIVATTQASINLTLKTFLSGLREPECIQCYVADDDDNPVPIDYEELKRLANGSDPFSDSIRDGDTPETSPDVKNLNDAGFLTAFKARIGLPPVSDPSMIPNVVELGFQISAVTYRLLCSEFTVVELKVGRHTKWVKAFQETDSPWLFESKVDLRLNDVDGTQYHTLPPDVQQQIKNLGANMFSVQQLLFDLDNATLSSTLPVIKGVEQSSQAYDILTRFFLNTYFQAQRAAGQPVLGCVIQQGTVPDPGTLHATDLNFGASPMVDANGNTISCPTDDQKDLTTLNYLMMTGGERLPAAVPFPWNWVTPEQAADFHGTMAVSRTAYANSLKDQIAQIAQPNCLVPSVDVSKDGRSITYHASVSRLTTPPEVTIPAAGSTILRVDYESEKAHGEADACADYEMNLQCYYTITVDVLSDSMTVTQHERVHIYLRSMQTSLHSDIVDKTLIDVYKLGVDCSGAFVGSDPVSTERDDSDHESVSGFLNFFTGLNDIMDYFTDRARKFTSQSLKHVPLNDVRSFVFPGGRTFAFKDLAFSNFQDLTCHITYLDPTASEDSIRVARLVQLAPSAPSSARDLNATSEVLTSFLPSEVIAPQKQFEAVQTAGGCSLLFSIGTDDHFYVVAESPDATGGSVSADPSQVAPNAAAGPTQEPTAGWVKTDLAASVLAARGPGSRAKTFAVQQNAGGTIDLVLVVSASDGDHVYACGANAADELGWLALPNWIEIPYDDPDHVRNSLSVQGVYLLQDQSSRVNLFVVDVDNGQGFVFRYFIDPNKTRKTGHAWNAHDLADNADRVLGTRLGWGAQGTYPVPVTFILGTLMGSQVLLSCPLYDVFGSKAPPPPVRLKPPTGATAIGVTSSGAGQRSELWIAAGGGLYFYDSSHMMNDASGVLVYEDDVLADVVQLHAWSDSSRVVIWGLNRQEQIFYLTCDRSNLLDRTAWSVPMPLLGGVVSLSPYVNRVDDGNTFFAEVGGNRLIKSMQAPATTLWSFQDIRLPTPDGAANPFTSYTTRFQVVDDQNAPVSNEAVYVSANQRVPVYVNGRYYVLASDPIQIRTDANGGLTVLEAAESLAPAILTVTLGNGTSVMCDPMAHHAEKLYSLNTEKALSTATITYSNRNTPSKELVPADTDESAKATAADTLGQLGSIRAKLPSDGSVAVHEASALALCAGAVPHESVFFLTKKGARITGHSGPRARALSAAQGINLAVSSHDFGDAIRASAGDVVQFFKTMWDKAEDAFVALVNVGEKVWHFVATIAEKTFYFVLDCIQTVAHAIEVVFMAILTGIEDIIAFISYLFDWDAFCRTSKAFAHLIHVNYQSRVAGVESYKAAFADIADAAQAQIDNWAAVSPDTWAPMEETGDTVESGTRRFSPLKILTAPSMWLYEQIVPYLIQIELKETPASDPSAGKPFDILLALIKNEFAVVTTLIQRIREELLQDDLWKRLPLGDLFRKLTAIVTDAILDTVENLVDGIVDAAVAVLEVVLAILEAEISFPILDRILHFFGVDGFSFSLLGMLSMVGAIPATIYYRLVRDAEPFPQCLVDKLLAANTPAQVAEVLDSASSDVRESYATAIFVSGKVVGGCSRMLLIAPAVAQAMTEEGKGAGAWGTFDSAASTVAIVSDSIAGLAPKRYPLQTEWAANMESVVSDLKLVTDVALAVGPKVFAKGSKGTADSCAQAGMVADVALRAVNLVPIGVHFCELSQQPANANRSIVIIERTRDLVALLVDSCKLAATLDSEPISKATLVASTGILQTVSGGLDFSEAIVAAV